MSRCTRLDLVLISIWPEISWCVRTLSNAVDTVLLSRVQLTYSMPVDSGSQIGNLVSHMHDLIDMVSYPVGTFSSVNSYHGISPASFEVRTGIGVVE